VKSSRGTRSLQPSLTDEHVQITVKVQVTAEGVREHDDDSSRRRAPVEGEGDADSVERAAEHVWHSQADVRVRISGRSYQRSRCQTRVALCPQLGHARDLHVCVTTRVSGRKNLGSETKVLRPAPWKTPQERLGENSRDLTDRVCRQAVVADGLGGSR